MNEDQPTAVNDVALPVEIVTLKHLKTKSGEAVRVRCEALSELVLADILKSLPGARPEQTENVADDPMEAVRVMNTYAPPLIEKATSFVNSGGTEVRPAFWFTVSTGDALPGRMLREEDKLLLVTTILRLGGYLADASEGAFPVQDGSGDAPSVGT